MSDKKPVQQHNDAQELNNILMFSFGGFLLYLLLIIIIKYLAYVSPYFYYFFTMPVFAFAGGRVTAGLIVLSYALICLGIAFLAKAKKGKLNTTALAYSVFWVFIAIGEFLFFKKTESGMISTPLTKHVEMFCNPSNDGILYIFSCQATIDDINKMPIAMIIMVILLPNFVYAIYALIQVFRNFANLAKHPKKQAKKFIPDVDSLINTVAPHQPHLQLYKDIDPNKIDWNSGQLRLMDSPRRYCFENDLVDNFVKRPSKKNPSAFKDESGTKVVNKEYKFEFEDMNEKPDLVPSLDIEKFERTMVNDLGEIFTNVESLNACQVIVMGLALSLACRADLKMDEKGAKSVLNEVHKKCDEVFEWVAQDIHKKYKVKIGMERYPKLQEFRDMITRWDDHPIAKEIYANHAYVNTIILRCLTDAKKLGVFQPSSLRWLMFYDRKLFAVIQNESRPSVFAENAATSSHFFYELKAGKKIPRPMMQIAYNGFMDNLREYSYSKKEVLAWKHFKKTGDASKMIELQMVSEKFKYGRG